MRTLMDVGTSASSLMTATASALATRSSGRATEARVKLEPVSSRRQRDRLQMPLSERELAALVAYAQTGDLRAAAARLGLPHSTIKSLLCHAYERLNVYGAINAFRALGWLTVP